MKSCARGVTETTLYIAGLLERVTKPSIVLWKHYVTAPTGVGAVYVRRSDGTSDTYYVTTDHLGSTDKLLKAATGTVQVAESFAPFGARRGSAWQGAPSAADLTAIGNSTPDGFTGHEMLDGVGLIHMNGRVYDPTVGRFLSVDPIVRDIDASQSWNGYGYVEGRTLSWTDPSGWQASPAAVKNAKPRDLPRSAWVTSIYYRDTTTLTQGTDSETKLEWVQMHLHEGQYFSFGDFMSMSGGRGNAASFGSVNEAQEVDREPQSEQSSDDTAVTCDGPGVTVSATISLDLMLVSMGFQGGTSITANLTHGQISLQGFFGPRIGAGLQMSAGAGLGFGLEPGPSKPGLSESTRVFFDVQSVMGFGGSAGVSRTIPSGSNSVAAGSGDVGVGFARASVGAGRSVGGGAQTVVSIASPTIFCSGVPGANSNGN